MNKTLSIRDFEGNKELFHKALRMIITYLKEMHAEDESFNPEYEINWLESVLAGKENLVEDEEVHDALLVPAEDGEGVMLFFILYRDEALIEKIYEANRELLMFDEREISLQDFKDAVLHIFNPEVDEMEAEDLYYSLRFEGMDMAHFCLYKDEDLYVGFAAFGEDEEEEEEEDEDFEVNPELN
jgi:hypothetical protein